MPKTYRGGIPFKRKYLPAESSSSFVPERIFLTLSNADECLCREGDKIKKYAKLLPASVDSAAVFSGVGGTVEKLSRIAGRVDLVILTDCDAKEEEPFPVPQKKLADMTDAELYSLLYERGITPPKRGKRDPKALTVDCGGSPYNDSRLYLCRHFPKEVIGGAKILMKLLGARSCSFAIPASDLTAAQKIEDAITERNGMLKIVLTKDKLPVCIPYLTVSSLYGVEVNAAKNIADAGYPVVSPLTCIACYRALVNGIPYCETYLSVADTDGSIDMFSLPFGTPLSDIACAGENETVIRAKKLFGKEIGSSVMRERTEAIRIIPKNSVGETKSRECIGCGRCYGICPARLSPIGIFSSAKAGKDLPSLVLYAAGCFECRACSYVCPSELPLAETIIKLRHDNGIASVELSDEDHDENDEIPEEADHEQ